VATERIITENYLLTLASRLSGVRCVVVLVEEADGVFSHHKAKFSNEGSWINAIGNLQALSHDILTTGVVWNACNPDGTDIDEAPE
jgi:hypothetical protein